jgi:hypothetical protein
MATCLGRLGSRFSLILDPIRREIKYGPLGLLCQPSGQMIVALDDGRGNVAALPLGGEGQAFHTLDQRQTMTSVIYEGHSLAHGVMLTMRVTAPFWPRDVRTSCVPAYIVQLSIRRSKRVRWTRAAKDASFKGLLRFGLRSPGVAWQPSGGGLRADYNVNIDVRRSTGEGGSTQQLLPPGRHVPMTGRATDQIVPLDGAWKAAGDVLEAAYDVSGDVVQQDFTLAIMTHVGDALFERFEKPMAMKYASLWKSPSQLSTFVKKSWRELVRKSLAFDRIWEGSSLGAAAVELAALSFQSYLMCTLWCAAPRMPEWFSVWEGSCWFNSTVDVTMQEAMFYFACWPELLEMIFQEWSHHADDVDGDLARRQRLAREHQWKDQPQRDEFRGRILQHDMGSGWTANGQSYHHAMPVEENSNFLLLLYSHGVWWGREKLFASYAQLCRDLVEYLLWSDSKGNGFPDRGTANTIDDATPAVQYGRDNVYLGIKRLAALHAAGRIFEHVKDTAWARRCHQEVRRAVRTLNGGWLGDHWGVCLDKSAKGLLDAWSHQPLPYRTLPGWDAYSLYTTNGLLPLMLVGDLPAGISRQRLRTDLVNAMRESMMPYGCGHSSMDTANVWVSMNVWRDLAGAYLGVDALANCQRYWNQQLFANAAGSEKANCFTETSLTNNLVWYPRNTAMFGLPMAMAGLVCGRDGSASIHPVAAGRWPLLALADWSRGKVPAAQVELRGGRLAATVETPPRKPVRTRR